MNLVIYDPLSFPKINAWTIFLQLDQFIVIVEFNVKVIRVTLKRQTDDVD